MDTLSHLDWSEIIYQTIEARIRKETKKSLAKAILINDKVWKKAHKGFNSTKIIREFRERRS